MSALEVWNSTAKHGDAYVYHTGKSCLGDDGKKLAEARRAWELAVAGEIILFQRRLGKGLFNYIAIKVPPKLGKAMAPMHKQHESA